MRPFFGGRATRGRFEPERALAARACTRLRKAARLLVRVSAALEAGGFVFAGSPEEKEFNRAFGGAIQAAENARHDLQRALERADAIKQSAESRRTSDPSQEDA